MGAAGAGGLALLFLRPVRGFRLRKIAGPLTAYPHGFQPPPEGMRTERTVILMTQMRREQFDTPHRRPGPQMKGMAVQMPENLGSRHLGCGHRTATPRGITQGGHLMARQIALEPVVDGLPTDTRQGGDLAVSPWATHSRACTR